LGFSFEAFAGTTNKPVNVRQMIVNSSLTQRLRPQSSILYFDIMFIVSC